MSVVDERTLTFRLQEACPYFLGLTTMAIFFPVKQDAVETADIYGNNPVAWVQDAGFVTSGAYTVENGATTTPSSSKRTRTGTWRIA